MNQAYRHALILVGVTLFMFWWRLGALPLIDPDEPFYAQTTREMLQANDWVTPRIFGQPQFEKPIMFYWETMSAQILFGDTAFAARAPSALFATLLVFLTWGFGRRFMNPQSGFYAALALATGIEFAFMSRLMMTDVSLSFFISASVFCFLLATEDEPNRTRWLVLHFVASGCAALTKGPIGLIIPALGSMAYLRLAKKPSPWRGTGLCLGVSLWLVTVVPWYATMFAKFGWEYWERFFVHENWERLIDSEHDHSNRIWYYPLILFAGSLPWIPLLAAAVAHAIRDLRADRRLQFLASWFFPNLLFFTLAQSKLPTYVLFLFVPLALLMGRTLDAWLAGQLPTSGRSVEIILARIFAAGQMLMTFSGAVLLVLIVPKGSQSFLQDFKPLLFGLSGMVAISVPFLFNGMFRTWAALTAAVSAGVVALALSQHQVEIASYSSSRDVAVRIHEFRQGNEPLVTSPFLARAVTYYAHETPAAVAFLRDPSKRKLGFTQPFFTPHPLNIVVDEAGLAEFIQKHDSVLLATQVRDRERINGPGSVLQGRCEPLLTLGDRCLFRISARK
jgi:4-amino-4-deoxy-L-arabinose transferase-like glycosyltransferase